MNFDEGARSARLEPVSVLQVPRYGVISVLFLGQIQGLLTHWHKGRSWPCSGEGRCVPALHRERSLWRGYAPVEWWDPGGSVWRPRVLEVTELAEEQLRGNNLRGQVWVLSRRQVGRQAAPVECLYLETRTPDGLALSFDMRQVLRRLWHVDEIDLGVPNPLATRLLLPPSAGDPPRMPAVPADATPQAPTADQLAEIRRLAGRAGTPPKASANGQQRPARGQQ